MTNYKPVANILANDAAKRREFSLQLVMAVTPVVTQYFLNISERLLDLHIARIDGITADMLLNYEQSLSPIIGRHIKARTTSIVETFHAECQSKTAGAEEYLSPTSGSVVGGTPM